MTRTTYTTRGFANLMGIMIITVIGTSATLALLTLDTASVHTTIAMESLARASANADACLEDALLSVRSNDQYEGVTVRSLNAGSCTGTTTNTLQGDGTRTVNIVTLGTWGDIMLHTDTSFTISYPPPGLPLHSRAITVDVP